MPRFLFCLLLASTILGIFVSLNSVYAETCPSPLGQNDAECRNACTATEEQVGVCSGDRKCCYPTQTASCSGTLNGQPARGVCQTTTCNTAISSDGGPCGTGHCCIPKPPLSSGATVLKDPLGDGGILVIVSRIIGALLGILGVLGLLVFVYAGVIYMTAGGSSERVKHAVGTMKFAMIGLGLIVFSYVIVRTFFQSIAG